MINRTAPTALITEGSVSQGSLTFSAKASIHGTVEGEVLQQSLEPIVVGRTGWIHGSISSQGPVIIGGRVEGNIYSATCIRLLPTAQVKGSLVSKAVEIHPGACFNGDTVMRMMKNSDQGLKHAA